MQRVDTKFTDLLLTHMRNLCIFDLKIPHGAVAQLGERVNGIHEAEGSIPFSSTTWVSSEQCVSLFDSALRFTKILLL